MLRWFGALLILCGGLLTRQALLSGSRSVQQTRRELADAFEAMAAEIRALLTPLPALLRRSYGESVEGFFAETAELLACGVPLSEAWRLASEVLALPPGERETVAALGGRLGGGEDSVCAALTLTAAALRKAYELNEAQRKEKERLTTSICICISLFLAILLL